MTATAPADTKFRVRVVQPGPIEDLSQKRRTMTAALPRVYCDKSQFQGSSRTIRVVPDQAAGGEIDPSFCCTKKTRIALLRHECCARGGRFALRLWGRA